MAEKSFGFNSAGTAPGDRAYSAADYMFWLNVHFGGNNGVVPNFLNQLAVTSLGAYNISINTGGAIYNGYAYSNDSSVTKILSSVDTTYKRYDRIVVRFDAATARSAVITVITGTPSTGTPSIPSAGSSDITLGTVYINNTSGTPSFTVTDDRSFRLLPVSANSISPTAIMPGSKFKHFGGGGDVSGVVTLPSIEVGQTGEIEYTTVQPGSTFVASDFGNYIATFVSNSANPVYVRRANSPPSGLGPNITDTIRPVVRFYRES